MTLPTWKQVRCVSRPADMPSQRWGHRFLTIDDSVILYGGFGKNEKESQYLDDLWIYNSVSMGWSLAKTKGHRPQQRSNYTWHYCRNTNQVIFFAGGADNKLRYNTMFALDWKNKEWREIKPQSQEQPWERTYHISELAYPYLIVHGGEGIANIDLDDTWIFDFTTCKWTEIKIPKQDRPVERRFHTSALIDSNLYIIGGCRGDYECLGEIYCMELVQLLENGDASKLAWNLILKNNLICRWGQTINVFNGKAYIFGGRSDEDHNDLLAFDPNFKAVAEVKVASGFKPPERRRAASTMIGGTLVLFGGFNGNYLRDFSLINIIHCRKAFEMPGYSFAKVHENTYASHVGGLTDLIQQDVVLAVQIRQQSNRVAKLHTSEKILRLVPMLAILLKYQGNIFELPSFVRFEQLHILMTFVGTGSLVVPKFYSPEDWCSLAYLAEYLCLEKGLREYIELQIDNEIKEANYHNFIALGLSINSFILQHKCFQLLIRKCSIQGLETNHIGISKDNAINQEKTPTFVSSHCLENYYEAIKRIYDLLKFELAQERLADRKMTIFEKAARKIRVIIKLKKDPSSEQNSLEHSESFNLMETFMDFVAKICPGSQNKSSSSFKWINGELNE